MRVLLVCVAALTVVAAASATATSSLSWTGDFHHQVKYAFTTNRGGDIVASTTYKTGSNTEIVVAVERKLADGTVDVRCATSTTPTPVCTHSIAGGVVTVALVAAPAGNYVVTINPWKGGKNTGVLTVTAETD